MSKYSAYYVLENAINEIKARKPLTQVQFDVIYSSRGNSWGGKSLNIEFDSLQEMKNSFYIQYFYTELNDLNKAIFDKHLETSLTLGQHTGRYNCFRCYRSVSQPINLSNYLGFIYALYAYQAEGFDIFEYLAGKEYEYTTMYEISTYYACLLSLGNSTGEKLYNVFHAMIYDNEQLVMLSHDIIRGLIMSTRPNTNEMVMDLLKSAKLSEGLRSAVMESIDFGTLATFKYFLEYVRSENLTRFSSVKRAFMCFSGTEYRVDESSADLICQYTYDCLLDGKTEEYLNTTDSLKVYMALYSMACNEFEDTLLHMINNMRNAPMHIALIYASFLNNGGFCLSDDMVAYLLENIDQPESMYILESTPKNIHDDGLKRLFISKIAEALPKMKSKIIKIKSLDGITEDKHDMDSLYMQAVNYAHEIDDLYDVVYPLFNKYFSEYRFYYIDKIRERSGYGWNNDESRHGEMADVMLAIPAARAALTDALASTSGMFAYKLLEARTEELTKADFIAISDSFKSKRSEVRQYASNLLLKASDDIIIECAKHLLADKKVEKRSAGISLLYGAYDKIATNQNFIAMQEDIRNANIPDELVKERDQLLGEKTAVDTPTGFDFDSVAPLQFKKEIAYDKNVAELFRSAVSKLTGNKISNQVKLSDVKSMIEKFTAIYESHIDEDIKVEYARYSNDTKEIETRKVGHDIFLTYTTYYHDQHYKSQPFYLEYAEMLSPLTDEEFFTLTIFAEMFDQAQRLIVERYTDNVRYLEGLNTGYILNDVFGIDIDVVKNPTSVQLFDDEDHFKRFNVYLGTTALHRYETHENMWKDHSKALANIAIQFIMFDYERQECKRPIFKQFEDIANTYKKRADKIITQAEESYMFRLNGFIDAILKYAEKTLDRETYDFIFYNMLTIFVDREYTMPTELMQTLFNKIADGEISKDYVIKIVLNEAKEKIRGGGTMATQVARRAKNSLYHGMKKFDEKAQNAVIETYKAIIGIILPIELDRTESETDYSNIFLQYNFEGVATFAEAVFKMGKMPFVRGGSYAFYSGTDKKTIFSHIIENTAPEKNLTAEQFKAAINKYKITPTKLLEACMYNLRFMPYLEEYFGVKGLLKGAYYFRAHMNEHFDDNTRKMVARYSDIDVADFQDGQVDLNWFNSTYEELGESEFQKLYDAAKYITDGAKHKRAQHFADAIRGNLSLKDVVDKINDKRTPDMVLAYGLIPFEKDKTADAIKRYKFLQNFLKESKQFGAQKRATEATKVKIALNNLARNYGMRDSNRFMWSMEIEMFEQIKELFTPTMVEDAEMYISIEDIQKPKIMVSKGGKAQKSIPANLKKHEHVLKLNEAVKDIKNQFKRAKATFEDCMVYEDEFMVDELKNLQNHPVISMILKDLLFVSGNTIGLLDDVCTKAGKNAIRVAHPVDLLENNVWTEWQKYMLENAVAQPFKQVFRELYTVTKDEEQEAGKTTRFAGYQIEPKRALGLLKTRGWIVNEYEGFEKVNHKHNIRINLYSYADWFMASEIESPTLELIEFIDNKTDKRVELSSISKVLYSEIMRDLDLVVSVAYVGGVDPLMNHTTIEMRTRILEHNLNLFGIKNYSIDKNHIMIEGKLHTYSVHLGSAVAHIKGRGMLPVFPVHSQHRGHIFLPFIDSDPKTSELVSLVLMLAEDNKIKDPNILLHLR